MGKLVIFVHGTKPTPCHRVDLVPMKTDSPSFAAAWSQDGEFCPAQEVPYSYSEGFASSLRAGEILLLCAGQGGKPEERKVPVQPIEPHSLRALRATSPVAGIAGFNGASFDAAASPSADMLRMLALHMHSAAQTQVASARAPFTFGAGLGDAALRGAAQARNDGKFGGEAKWWNAGYSQCEILIDTDDGRWYFRGQGGGFPGAGAYSGDLYTGDLGRLIQQTATCQIVSALFYVNITFWDAGSGNLGVFHGGGAGVGGGLLAGHWTR
jgi:hypothetical protein